MKDETNLGLDLDHDGEDIIARVTLVGACGYTRQGDPTLSADCANARALEREVGRLKDELDAIADRARDAFGAPRSERRERVEPEAAARPAKPKLDAALTVGEVMTRDVKTVDRNDRVSVADELMKTGRFRHVVVLDQDRRVAGVVSHRDIVYSALAWTLGQGRSAHDKALESRPVKDVMATNVITVDSEASLGEAAAMMRERQLGCLPVVDGDELVGILTEGDVLYLLAA